MNECLTALRNFILRPKTHLVIVIGSNRAEINKVLYDKFHCNIYRERARHFRVTHEEKIIYIYQLPHISPKLVTWILNEAIKDDLNPRSVAQPPPRVGADLLASGSNADSNKDLILWFCIVKTKPDFFNQSVSRYLENRNDEKKFVYRLYEPSDEI